MSYHHQQQQPACPAPASVQWPSSEYFLKYYLLLAAVSELLMVTAVCPVSNLVFFIFQLVDSHVMLRPGSDL